MFSRVAQGAAHGVNPQELLAKLPISAVGRKSKDARMWTPEEDAMLRAAVEQYGDDWNAIAGSVPGRNKLQCVQRWKKTLKPGQVKGPWKPEEDSLLLHVMSEEVEGDWQAISRRVPGRNAKQCKERWMLNLNPQINHGPWTAEEDAMLIDLHAEVGGRWSILAKRLEGRTEHAIKTRFLSLQKRAARVRNWTVDEDRIILEQFMRASNLDGVAATIKVLPGRTKRQVQERWRHLREHYVSIDDLATSQPQGGIMLTEQDLRNLIPTPSLTGTYSNHTSPRTFVSASTNSSATPEMRTKSLARRQQESSSLSASNNPGSTRHMRKRLEKSESSSSHSQQRAVAALGSEIFNNAYGSSSLNFSSSSNNNSNMFVETDPHLSQVFASSLQQQQHQSSALPSSTMSSGDVQMTDDPFVVGLLNAGLQAPSMFASSSSSSNPQTDVTQTRRVPKNQHGQASSSTNKSLQRNGFSSSFIFPPFSPQPIDSTQQHPNVSRQDSFSRLAGELEQLNYSSAPTFLMKPMNVPGTNGAVANGFEREHELFRAFSGLAPELGSTPTAVPDVPSWNGDLSDMAPAPLMTQDSLSLDLDLIPQPPSSGEPHGRLRKWASSAQNIDRDLAEMFPPSGYSRS